MSCYNQSGVREIKLYENIDLTVTYDPVTEYAIAITAGGATITIGYEYRPDFVYATTPSDNYDYINNYTLRWYNFDLATGRTLIDTLRNYYGWYAIITFNDGESVLIDSPVFINSNSSLTSSTTHTWLIEMNNEVDTFGQLVTFEQGELSGIGYMEIENDFIVS